MTDNLFWSQKKIVSFLKSYGATKSQSISTFKAMQKTYFDDARERHLLVISNQVPRRYVWKYLETYLDIHPESQDEEQSDERLQA